MCCDSIGPQFLIIQRDFYLFREVQVAARKTKTTRILQEARVLKCGSGQKCHFAEGRYGNGNLWDLLLLQRCQPTLGLKNVFFCDFFEVKSFFMHINFSFYTFYFWCALKLGSNLNPIMWSVVMCNYLLQFSLRAHLPFFLARLLSILCCIMY